MTDTTDTTDYTIYNPYITAGDGQTYDAFGNVVDAGSAAASSADPTGLAQLYQDLQNSTSANGNMWDAVSKLLSGTSSLGTTGKVAGIAGLTALMSKLSGNGTQGIYRGYTGSIPNYTGTRTMNPIPTTAVNAAGQTVARRPGQGGISYFTPMQYSVSNAAPATAADMLPPPKTTAADGGLMGYAAGGIASLGGYSDGGRLLRGPGDGVSDSIPATIGGHQPAKLADGEFVIPARIVSEIGNGSTEAGARKLYAMMDRVQQARRKTTGKDKVATNTRADQYLPR